MSVLSGSELRGANVNDFDIKATLGVYVCKFAHALPLPLPVYPSPPALCFLVRIESIPPCFLVPSRFLSHSRSYSNQQQAAASEALAALVVL